MAQETRNQRMLVVDSEHMPNHQNIEMWLALVRPIIYALAKFKVSAMSDLPGNVCILLEQSQLGVQQNMTKKLIMPGKLQK